VIAPVKQKRYYRLLSQRLGYRIENQTIVSSPGVIIFRKRLLSYSETFIADQGQLLPTYKPVFCGYAEDRSGISMIEKSDKLLLSDYSSFGTISKMLLRNGLPGASAWIKEIARSNPAVLHAHFFNDGVDAIRIGVRLDVPVITTVHGHDITKHQNAVAQTRGNQRFFEQVDCVVAVSEFIANEALVRGCPEDKLIQHYIGIDLEKFELQKNESDHPSLLFVGRLVEKKGCTYLLQAMQKLKSRHPELELTIVGDGDLKTELQQEAQSKELNVNFAGTEDAAGIRDRLARCWLFVAPSITAENGDAEGLGMVFLEAQALHTPVVSFRSGGLVEAVAENETALLSDEKDVEGLADNIAQLLENNQQRHHMGMQGRRRVEQSFDVRKQCAKLEQIYNKLT
jgi:colanic acid/amylovoran biosynthesis glycosyltransferase